MSPHPKRTLQDMICLRRYFVQERELYNSNMSLIKSIILVITFLSFCVSVCKTVYTQSLPPNVNTCIWKGWTDAWTDRQTDQNIPTLPLNFHSCGIITPATAYVLSAIMPALQIMCYKIMSCNVKKRYYRCYFNSVGIWPTQVH